MTDPEFKPTPLPLDGVDPPRFYEWNTAPGRWELLTARLMDRDPLYRASDLFELRGLTQYGLDSLAEIRSGGQVGLSAKCYEKVTPAKIRDWCTDFLKHWDSYWSKRDIRAFILAIAAPNVVNAGNRDQIAKEKIRFAKLGIAFDVWGPEPVFDRLRPHADLVARFLSPGWRDLIFGPQIASTTAVDAVLLRQLEQTQGVLAEQVEARLSGAQELLWAGAREEVAGLLGAVTATTVWPLLPDSLKADALRIAARMAIDDRRLAEADQHAEAAQALAPAEPLIEAKIAQARGDPGKALEILGSPTTQAGHRYEASLKIAQGHFDEGERLLTAINEEPDDPAEADRLMAFVRLGQGRYDEALSLSEAAADRAPGRLLVRLGLAVARYANGLSPSTPSGFALRALTPPSGWIRQDADSITRRRLALDGFRTFEDTEFGKLVRVQDWILVCLTCLEGGEAEAISLVESRLAASPLDLTAAYTVLTRTYPVDLSATRDALKDLINAGEAEGEQVRLYVQLRLSTGPHAGVLEDLEGLAPRLEGEGRDEAERWIEELRPTPEPIDGDPVAQLATWLDESPPDLRGLELAETLAGANRWSDLAPFLDRIEKFRTPTSVSLAAYVMHHTAQPADLLAFIDDNTDAYPDGRLPLDMRRLRLSTLSDIDPTQAIEVSQALALETGAVSDRQHLVGLLLGAGTAQTALPVIRRLLADGAVKAGDAIRYSVAVTGDDLSLAKQLWRHAMKEGVPETFLLHALSQGYRLGLDDEVAPLMPRMAARAQSGAGDVWTFDVEDLPALITQRRSEVEDVHAKLLDGLIPIHIAPRGLVGSLAGLYRLDPDTDHPGPQPLILLRHGSRSIDLQAPEPWQDWQIILDPTALLIAEQLDLLDHVEALAKPTLISRSLPDVLYGFEQDVAPGQPARVNAARAVLAALGGGRLAVASDLSPDECVVHERDPGGAGHTVAEVAVVIAGGEAEPGGLVAGARLVFTVGTLESFAMDGPLDAVLSTFRCEIVPDDLRIATAEIRAAEEGDRLAARIRALRERVALGLTSGRYVSLPDPPDLSDDDDEEDLEPEPTDAEPAEDSQRRARRRTPLEACLVNGLVAPEGEGRVLWVDDRMTSGYLRSQDHPVVTVVEVMNALVAAGVLTADDRRAKLLRLRRGGAAFLPMAADEVLAPLMAASVRDRRLSETPDLVVLRRNLASAARQDVHLHISDGKGRASEQPFVSSMIRMTEDCLRAIWSDPAASHDDRVARSNWVWENLRIERCVRPLPVDQPGEGNTLLASVTFAGLFALGSQIDGGDYAERLIRRKAYIDWLDGRALKPRSGRAREAWLHRMGEQYRSLYEGQFDLEFPEDQKGLVLRLRHDEIQALPEVMREQLLEKPEFARAVGLRVGHFVTAGPHAFESTPFWSAAVKAIRSGVATVKSRDGGTFALRWVDNALHVDSPEPVVLAMPFAAALTAQGPARRAAIKDFLAGLDITPALREETLKVASRTRSHAALVQMLRAAENGVVANRYVEIDEALRAGGDVPMKVLLPPPAKAAIHALRLDGPGPLTDRAGQAWALLEAEHGKIEAFRRLGGLPVDLGDRIGDFTPSHPTSGIATIHAVAARRRRGDTPDDVVRALLAMPDDAYSLTIDLVDWSRKAYTSDADWLALEPEDQLALCWSHAHRLQTIVMRLSDDFAALRRKFQTYTPDQSVEQELTGAGVLRNDRAFPTLLQGASLLYHGLAHAFGHEAPRADLALDLQAALAERLVTVAPDGMGLHGALMFAGPRSTNVMASWLDRDPVGLVDETLQPEGARHRHFAAALTALEASPDDLMAWAFAGLLARGGCDAYNGERYVEAVKRADFATLALSEHGRQVCTIALEGLAGWSPLTSEELAGKMRDMASGYAKVMSGPIRLSDAASTKAVDPLVATLLAGAQDGDQTSSLARLHRGALAAASGWPALAPVFRLLFERWYGRADPSADSLWAGFVDFRAWA